MDPITALGATGSILQLVEAGAKVVDLCLQIRKHGTTEENKSLCQISDLAEETFTEVSALNPDSKSLLVVSQLCHDNSLRLKEEFQKLAVSKGSRLSVVLRKTIQSKAKSRHIHQLKENLDNFQRILNTKILVALGDKLNDLTKTQTEILVTLEKTTDAVSNRIGSENDTTKKLIVTESGHINDKLNNVAKQIAQDGEVTRRLVDLVSNLDGATIEDRAQADLSEVLDSLRFQGIGLRQQFIETPHKVTYHWILEDKFNGSTQHTSFIEWLSRPTINNEDNIYWVKGKPGSGKSMLMKLLASDATRPQSRIRSFLPRNTAIFSCFLWANGTSLEHSVVGLYRTLLEQILSEYMNGKHRSLLATITSVLNLTGGNRDGRISKQAVVWNRTLLMQTITASLDCIQAPLFILIDGLDEARDDIAIGEAVHFLRNLSNTRLCVSSRSSAALENLLGASTQILMQDLTKLDIQTYIYDKLIDDHEVRRMTHLDANDLNFLAAYIERKANGVFLWVELIVQKVLRGLHNKDDVRHLTQRLERMPDNIKDLYKDMWQRLCEDHDIYQPDSSLYFQLVYFSSMDLISFAIAINPGIMNSILNASSGADILTAFKQINIESVITWIHGRCAGFIEVVGDKSYSPPGWHDAMAVVDNEFLSELFRTYGGLRVELAHATVADFLRDERLIDPSDVASQQAALHHHKAAWCSWILLSMLGYRDFDERFPVGYGVPQDAKYDVRLKVESVLSLLAREGYLSTRPDWLAPLHTCFISSVYDSNLFPEDDRGGIDLSVWFLRLNDYHYIYWKHDRWKSSDSPGCWDSHRYTQLLWLRTLYGPQNITITDFVQELQFLQWLLPRGADTSNCFTKFRESDSRYIRWFLVALYRDCRSFKKTNQIQQVHSHAMAQTLRALLEYGAKPSYMSTPALRTFYPYARSALCAFAINWTPLGFVEEFMVPEIPEVAGLIDVLHQYGAESEMRLVFVSYERQNYPLSIEESDRLKAILKKGRGVDIVLSQWLEIIPTPTDNESSSCANELISALEEIATRTKPFSSPQDGMRRCGWSESDIEVGHAAVKSAIADVQHSLAAGPTTLKKTESQEAGAVETEHRAESFIQWLRQSWVGPHAPQPAEMRRTTAESVLDHDAAFRAADNDVVGG